MAITAKIIIEILGDKTDVESLKHVFNVAMKSGLDLWDTAMAYGMGDSESILGTLAQQYEHRDMEISTKFTPHIAEIYENSVEKMALASMERMELDHIDIYRIDQGDSSDHFFKPLNSLTE